MNEISGETEQSWYRTWFPRLAVATVLVLAVGFGVTWIFGSTYEFLITLLIAFFLAFALLPAVDWLSRRGWRRGAAAGVVMLSGGVILGVFAAAIGKVFIDQLISLVLAVPDMADTVVDWLNTTFDLDISIEDLGIETTDIATLLTERGTSIIGGVLGFTSSILGFVFRMLTVALFLFYILADTPKLRASLFRFLPPEQQLTADAITTVTIDKVGGWVYSRGVLAAISAAYHFFVFIIIDLPYPFALALWVGVVSQFIPTVGTYIAGAVPVLIGLVSGDPWDALWVIIAITVYQQIENYLVSPKITANTMELHPAVAFGSAIVGASLLGGLGAILALPVAATATALVQTYGIHHELVESESFESPEQYEARLLELENRKIEEGSRTGRFLDRWRNRDETEAT